MSISDLALTAKKVIDGAWLNGSSYDLASQAAFALEDAQLLQSPETAAEHEKTRTDLEKRTSLLLEVQRMCRQRGKEIKGRKTYGDRLKESNAALAAGLHKARTYTRAVEELLAKQTPFRPQTQEATLLAIKWLRESLDNYRGRVDSAEVYARRTDARIRALLAEPTDPQACALCNIPQRGHAIQTTYGFAHTWTRPKDELVRERMMMRRALERSASGEPAESELMWLRARVTELEAERHATNEALDDAVKTLREQRDRIAELEATPKTVYRAVEDSLPMGLYTTREAAQNHCEIALGRKLPDWDFAWGEEADGVQELELHADGKFNDWSGYVVTALEVAPVYDEEADE
ncbi:hypothetical protein [Streptomyces spinosirectus]